MDAKTKRGCLWVAVGAAVLMLIVGAAVLGGAAWLVYQSSSAKSVEATPADAGQEFSTIRARFAGQEPLIAVDDRKHATIVPRKRTSDAALTSLHVVAFDPKERRLKRMTFPFWLLRLSPGRGELQIGNDTLLDETRVTVKDVEDAGPGLVLDHAEADGRRVLVWTE
jgi:hypothetical protein